VRTCHVRLVASGAINSAIAIQGGHHNRADVMSSPVYVMATPARGWGGHDIRAVVVSSQRLRS
jgi:hypothetical protein